MFAPLHPCDESATFQRDTQSGNLCAVSDQSQPKDIRWIQRFDNFKRAYARLSAAAALARQRKLSELEEQGLVQAFEFTHELAWNTLKN